MISALLKFFKLPPDPWGSELDRSIGSRLRWYRGRSGMTIDQLADAMAVSGRDIARFETGRKRISARLLFILAKLFGVQVSDFFVPARAGL